MKRMGDNKDTKMAEETKNSEATFDYSKEQNKIQDAIGGSPTEGTDPVVEDEDKGALFLASMDEPINRTTPVTDLPDPNVNAEVSDSMSLHDNKKFAGKGFTSANEIYPNPSQDRHARAASKFDISKLDESMILDMPQIKAATFEIITMLELKPKDPAIRFRWANYKNFVSGNLARYYALGFQNASIDDIDVEKTPVHESMLEGSTVKYYDIILLKVSVLRLMELYKANMIKSVNRLIEHRERGLREANRDFASGLSAGDRANYNKLKEALGREPVEFFVPGAEESQVVTR